MDHLRMLLLVVITTFLLVSPVHAQDNTLINGTLIITLISQDTIWLGADSRTSALTDDGYTVNKDGMCKIYSTNDVIYAMAGHVRYVDNSFNFLEIMQSSINEQKDFERCMELFQQRAKIEIASILKRFSRESINTLIKTNNGTFLNVVAISFVNGEKKVKEMNFSIKAISRNNWNVTYNVTEQNDVGSLRFVGHATNASKFVRNNNLYFGNGRNIPEKINDLIELESKGTITVGMPADVISIYNNGYKRIISSGLCSE
ncbi:MAG: hypothetical protein JWQ09_5370 [Segetibacter sp.]|nr:hypothetical protein [Segetibacter sp.]